MKRTCKKCGEEKDIVLFVKNSYECKQCRNEYMRKWKKNNYKYASRRRELYLKKRKEEYEKKKEYLKQREQKRKELYPFKCRAQLLRAGMRDRARKKKLEFDNDLFTVKYLQNRLIDNPYCECCGKKLDISFKLDKKFNDDSPSMDRVDSQKGYIRGNVAILCWRCNKHKQDSTSEELRRIADFIDNWRKRSRR